MYCRFNYDIITYLNVILFFICMPHKELLQVNTHKVLWLYLLCCSQNVFESVVPKTLNAGPESYNSFELIQLKLPSDLVFSSILLLLVKQTRILNACSLKKKKIINKIGSPYFMIYRVLSTKQIWFSYDGICCVSKK